MRIVGLVLGLPLLFAACERGKEAERPRPNVLIVSIDTLRADHMGCYGYPRPTSPNIDAFAARSTVFEQVASSSTWTLPSMTTLMTGLSMSAHNCDHLGSRLDPSYTTLAELLRDAGYDTKLVASHLFLGAPYGLQQGFTHVDTSVVQEENDITSQDVSALGLEWLRQKSAVHDGVPWMLWLHFFDPHAPYLAHAGVSEAFGVDSDLDRYDGEIAYTDRYVGALLDELGRSPLAQDTIVVLVADHGEEFGEHGNFGHGYALYEECVRVPLILHVPGMQPRRVVDVVPTVDLLPTLLDLCRVPLRHEVEGQSVVPLLRAQAVPEQVALSEVRWMAGQDLRAARAGCWKWIEGVMREQRVDELHDLCSDPREGSELRAQDPQRAAALSERGTSRVRDARRIAGEHHQIGESQASPSEQRAMENTGYAGEGGGGVPKKKPEPRQEPPK
jgi:arylsulfatase A-like enzyme